MPLPMPCRTAASLSSVVHPDPKAVPGMCEVRPRCCDRLTWQCLALRGPRSGPGVSHAGAPARRGLGGAARSENARASSKGSSDFWAFEPCRETDQFYRQRFLGDSGVLGRLASQQPAVTDSEAMQPVRCIQPCSLAPGRTVRPCVCLQCERKWLPESLLRPLARLHQ